MKDHARDRLAPEASTTNPEPPNLQLTLNLNPNPTKQKLNLQFEPETLHPESQPQVRIGEALAGNESPSADDIKKILETVVERVMNLKPLRPGVL